ncbi:hypothetical protein [Porticoccus sp.]|uniref:hypothetical protein n=1 Tax=Porticoccus sp. TaxID=2024853 RepID=UPI0025E06B9F|nr:hypothetical protein [Porticoccus sp.]
MTQDPVRVEMELYRSLLLLVWILSIHSLAACLLIVSAIPLWLKVLTIIPVLVGGAHTWLMWYRQPVKQLSWTNGHWQLNRADQREDVTLQHFFRLGRLLLLRFHGAKRRYSVLVLPDSTSPANLRRIHVTLQLG